MKKTRIAKMIRHFPENGLKMLFEHHGNVRDLFRILRYALRDRIEFKLMKVQPATFIARDFRHLEADILLTVPFRPEGSRSRRQTITIYILIEHQSEPDHLMRFRVLDYVVQVYKVQMRKWNEKHKTLTNFKFRPVLPIVFYTGTRTWEALADMPELTEFGEQFRDILPNIGPLFLNLGTTEPDILERDGGPFGQVMRILRHRQDQPATLEPLLEDVIRQLNAMPDRERIRWKEMLNYLNALVYHYRGEPEGAKLGGMIEAAARSEAQKREIQTMTRTFAEVLKDEGRREGELLTQRRTLLMLLRSRFTKVPAKLAARIEAETNTTKLDEWLRRLLTAQQLDDLGIV